MTSRERVARAVHFQGPDRLPHYLPDDQENNIFWLWPKHPADIQPWEKIDGRQRRVDFWGVIWERIDPESMGEVQQPPIQDIKRHAKYKLPDLNNPAYLAGIKQAISTNNASNNPKYCLGVMPFASLHEGVHALTGLENMFFAYHDYPDDLKALISRMAAKQHESIRILGDYGCDGIMGYDD